MTSLLEVLQKSAAFLERKGVEHPRLNAELLAGHALNLPRMQLYLQFERLLPERELELIRPLIKRRGQREPIQHILGSVDFSGINLKIDGRALIPRPETEYLVELLKAEWTETHPEVFADLGTGSGALVLALANHWEDSRAIGTDISADALALARENCAALELQSRVDLIESDWFSNFESDMQFDLIVANPPYLTAEEVAETQPEVKDHEPAVALSTAADGLDALHLIADQSMAWLKPGGLLAMETGIAQHPGLCERLRQRGFIDVRSRQDLTERDRFVFARKKTD
ncbi:MAG: peptide chain release factor N(5)-glutamine methyltransferase [Synoicihabitans sp.]